MGRGRTAVLTTTLYKSREDIRFHLALQFIGNAVGAGHTVIIVDNSPDLSICQTFSRIGAVVFRQESLPGMGRQKRELFRVANDTFFSEYYIWTEPEKPDLVRSIPQIVAPLEAGEAKIVIAGRTEESMKTYPEFQIESEMRINHVYAEATGLYDADPTFSPVAFTREMLPYFANCNPPAQYGGGTYDNYIQLYAPLAAMAEGHKATTVYVECFYPLAQKREEEGGGLLNPMREKRKMQSDTITSTWRKMAEVLNLPHRDKGLVNA